MQEETTTHDSEAMDRRTWLAKVLMGVGLLASYGTLAAQGLMFLLPERLKPRTRRLFVGPVDRFPAGSVSTIRDPGGDEILIKRATGGAFQAFSSTCPHLGCKVKWQAEEEQFLCPCHQGFFNADGVAISGPPADAGQNLFPAPLIVDEESGVVYLEVKDPGRKST
jgi:cytochrome b6-f complex iron-sulfur subunit